MALLQNGGYYSGSFIGDIYGMSPSGSFEFLEEYMTLRTAFGNSAGAFFFIGSTGFLDADFPEEGSGGIPGLEEPHVVYGPLSRFE